MRTQSLTEKPNPKFTDILMGKERVMKKDGTGKGRDLKNPGIPANVKFS